jgi:acetoin utilization deacetylase AcuC-like enzyme
LGVDTFAGDPISGFTLQSDDYLRIGADIARTARGRPVVFVFEGGYAVDEVGLNVVNVLAGYQDAAG